MLGKLELKFINPLNSNATYLKFCIDDPSTFSKIASVHIHFWRQLTSHSYNG